MLNKINLLILLVYFGASDIKPIMINVKGLPHGIFLLKHQALHLRTLLTQKRKHVDFIWELNHLFGVMKTTNMKERLTTSK